MGAAAIALIWLGMILGVSFLATPVKFVVQDLALPVALQVGQATFALFVRVEWALAAVLLAACALSWRTRPFALMLTGVLAVFVVLQAVWLLPALDARVAAIVAGAAPPPSAHHNLYAAFEAAKALLLAALSITLLRGYVRRKPAVAAES